jgi:hypothetical protein
VTSHATDPSGAATRLREACFAELRAAMPAPNFAAALRCATRLHAVLPHPDRLPANVVMVAYGGGKDSSYAVAFVRAVHLMLFQIHGSTFRLRIVTNRHAGMPRAVVENIDRAYRALRIPEDPDCETLLVDGDEVLPFAVDRPQSERVVHRNRLDVLMTGHLTSADARPTFCNSCNLSMVNSFGLAAAHDGGVDVLITGDSPREQRAYAVWVRRLARQVGRAPKDRQRGFEGFLADVDRIAQSYFGDIYGAEDEAAVAERRVSSDTPARLRFFSIYDDTEYAAGDHLQMLTGFLGFVFDDLAFSFTESDCGNPTLMAHLRGLKAERLHGRGYADGVAEYVRFAVELMRAKDFPEALVDTMLARYGSGAAVVEMRQAANRFASEAYGLTEEQLVCMVYAPFAREGEALDRYLAREQRLLAARRDEIHSLLAGEEGAGGDLAEHLEHMSGLPLYRLRALYASSLRGTNGSDVGAGLMASVLAGDPHKAVIRTRHSPDGPIVLEQISGR